MPRIVPPRLHILLAAQSAAALVICRSTAKTTCTIGWDRETDTFQLGQWFKGRIYERRCDLSPDGRHFLYFAANHIPGGPEAWTAISKTPWLRALSFWPSPSGCWNGGGLFLNSDRAWLNTADWALHRNRAERHDSGIDALPGFPYTITYGGECPGVYYHRLMRDGWQLLQNSNNLTIFRKALPHGWLLEKTCHSDCNPPIGCGCYWDSHTLRHTSSGTIQEHAWHWAEWDSCRNRLVWTDNGCLYAAALGETGRETPKMLHDFNNMSFQTIKAPYE